MGSLCYNRAMKKLIVKSKLLDRANFDRQIAMIGMKLSPVIWQHERVYLPHNYKPEQNLPRLVLRTEVQRTDQPAKYALYLKRHIEDSGVDWVNFTGVTDYTEASGIVHQLGFKKVAEISRQRRGMLLEEGTMLYVDTIEGISGDFLKIEANIMEGESLEALRKDLFTILRMLGLKTFTMAPYYDIVNNASAQEFIIPER